MRNFLLMALLLMMVTGCSTPRVIVLNDPLDAAQHNDLGVAYEARGEVDLAERAYERAAQLDRRWALPLVNLGNVRAGQKDWRGAIQAYEAALARDPADPVALNNLAWVLLQEGQLDRALTRIREAVALSPDNPLVLETLAEVHLARGEAEQARAVLDAALQIDPELPLDEDLQRLLQD
ncbi:tetratricopeptide repeat protein [Geoalkalibacter sp.]|uniref:tetratricopeptide repeat protein n=1 Tax=Geoalkalibacter sp. TaxID=3041440 RepID=UPI00272E1493|nr:tetratricopeptide repeat protein [Geoalkalibacter sp.]